MHTCTENTYFSAQTNFLSAALRLQIGIQKRIAPIPAKKKQAELLKTDKQSKNEIPNLSSQTEPHAFHLLSANILKVATLPSTQQSKCYA